MTVLLRLRGGAGRTGGDGATFASIGCDTDGKESPIVSRCASSFKCSPKEAIGSVTAFEAESTDIKIYDKLPGTVGSVGGDGGTISRCASE